MAISPMHYVWRTARVAAGSKRTSDRRIECQMVSKICIDYELGNAVPRSHELISDFQIRLGLVAESENGYKDIPS